MKEAVSQVDLLLAIDKSAILEWENCHDALRKFVTLRMQYAKAYKESTDDKHKETLINLIKYANTKILQILAINEELL